MVNPIQIQKYLKGMDYPASKQEIVEKAKENGADRNVIETLNRVAGQEFQTPAELSQALGKVE